MYVIMNLMHLESQISRPQHEMADCVTLTHKQVLSPYWMMMLISSYS